MLDTMLIGTGTLTRDTLAGRVAVVTGAGGGIGYEAARSLRWLGCRVVIAEIDRGAGERAARRIDGEFGPGSALSAPTDVGDERGVARLARLAQRTFGQVDVVLNNATVVALGAVKDLGIGAWDASYRVNLRGPVLLARAFLPGMAARRWGVFLCVSSAGTAYMGPYESMKAAQVHLGTTLDEELDGTGLSAFTIAPGFVPTGTASSSMPRLAALMGRSEEEMLRELEEHTLSVEAAGAGFAAAVAMAPRYHGQEISSYQALADAGIGIPAAGSASADMAPEVMERALGLCRSVRATLAEQSAAWKDRSVFERQWMIRTFRQKASLPVEEWLQALSLLESALERGDGAALAAIRAPLDRLAAYYAHLHEMAKGYLKDPAQRGEQLRIVGGWQADVERLHGLLR